MQTQTHPSQPVTLAALDRSQTRMLTVRGHLARGLFAFALLLVWELALVFALC